MALCSHKLSPPGEWTVIAGPQTRNEDTSGLIADGNAPILPAASCSVEEDRLVATSMISAEMRSIARRVVNSGSTRVAFMVWIGVDDSESVFSPPQCSCRRVRRRESLLPRPVFPRPPRAPYPRAPAEPPPHHPRLRAKDHPVGHVLGR